MDVEKAALLPSSSCKAVSAGPWVKEKLVHARMGHLNQEFVRLLLKVTNQSF
jgi:hypothetical protein